MQCNKLIIEHFGTLMYMTAPSSELHAIITDDQMTSHNYKAYIFVITSDKSQYTGTLMLAIT